MLASYHEAQLKMRIRQCCRWASEGQCDLIATGLNDLIVQLVSDSDWNFTLAAAEA